MAEAGKRNAMTYVELLKKLEDLVGNTKFYKTIYNCLSIAFSYDPNVNNWEQLKNSAPEALLSKQTLQTIRKCLSDALLQIGFQFTLLKPKYFVRHHFGDNMERGLGVGSNEHNLRKDGRIERSVRSVEERVLGTLLHDLTKIMLDKRNVQYVVRG